MPTILLPPPNSLQPASPVQPKSRTTKNLQEHQKTQTHSKPIWQRKGAVHGADGQQGGQKW
jgi:hypothetical protein